MARGRVVSVTRIPDHELARAAAGACRRSVAALDAETARRGGQPRDARGRFVAHRSPPVRTRSERLTAWTLRHWVVTTVTVVAAYWLVRAGLARVPGEVWTALGWALALVVAVVVALFVAVVVSALVAQRRDRRAHARIERCRLARAWAHSEGLPESAKFWTMLMDVHREAAGLGPVG
jgi:hypothetical protein